MQTCFLPVWVLPVACDLEGHKEILVSVMTALLGTQVCYCGVELVECWQRQPRLSCWWPLSASVVPWGWAEPDWEHLGAGWGGGQAGSCRSPVSGEHCWGKSTRVFGLSWGKINTWVTTGSSAGRRLGWAAQLVGLETSFPFREMNWLV